MMINKIKLMQTVQLMKLMKRSFFLGVFKYYKYINKLNIFYCFNLNHFYKYSIAIKKLKNQLSNELSS